MFLVECLPVLRDFRIVRVVLWVYLFDSGDGVSTELLGVPNITVTDLVNRRKEKEGLDRFNAV